MTAPKALRLSFVSFLVAVSFNGCGGDGGDTTSPEDPFPDVAGAYNISGGFDGLTSEEASFVGSLTLNQASRQSGELTGTMSATVNINGDVTTAGNVPIQSASVTPNGTVSFQLGSISNGGNWTFSGTTSGETIGGRHTLTDGTNTFSGDWSAASGSSLDPDGYTLLIDGVGRGTLTGNNPVTTSGLAPGNHSVGLSGVADNCEVQGDNPRLVTVSSGATASEGFNIVCSTPPAGAGAIRVTAASSGPDPDPDGYLATLDGSGPGMAVPTNGSATFPNVPVGSHGVALSGLASNCSVAGSSTATTAVSSGATADVSFTITCTSLPPSTGSIKVTTTTSGSDQDQDGYAFSIDGGAAHTIGVNGSQTVNDIPAGTHTVVLSAAAQNCSVDATSRSATVTVGATATVAFAITCTAIPPTVGSIRVSTSTTGANPDADGYQFAIDGGSGRAIGVSAAATVSNIPTGPHKVVLSGVASNCSVTGGASKNVTVTGGQTSDVAFSITCSAVGPSASRSTMLADPKSILAGGSSSITVTVRDASGGALVGVAVSLKSTGSGNTITPQSGITNASGVATFSFTSTVAENKTITATAAGVILDDTEVIVVGTRASSTEVTSIDPEPSTSGSIIHVTVSVTGEGGATPTGTVAVFSQQETGGCSAALLNSEGIATCDFALSLVGTHTIGASYSGDSQFEESSDLDGKEHEVIAAAAADQRASR